MNLKTCVLGLELGSTRIKAVLLDDQHLPVASGSFEWENKLVDGIWTYDIADIHTGVQTCFADLMQDVQRRYGIPLTTVGAIGISGMMHGYLAFDKEGQLLAPFRTWRNTITERAADHLTNLFRFLIPQRWSVAHLYETMLNKEEHLSRLDFLTTLCGYIHRRLTGQRVLGVGEAAGMFPVDSRTLDYDNSMVAQFDELIANQGYSWRMRDVFPAVLPAGADAGVLTAEGAAFLDPTGTLQPGIPLAPPEGDAGTGMVATNSVRVGTGNVSAGTSIFGMVVLDRDLPLHREINIIASPTGQPTALIHCGNCTSDINSWVGLLGEAAALMGATVDKGQLFTALFKKALEGDPDCGGLLSYNYVSGEGITHFNEGRPLFMRKPDAPLTLANFMRTHLMSALATLRIGLDILTVEEKVTMTRLLAHGGFFKTPGVGQRLLSAATKAEVTVMETAGEGGPYGMALLAAYRLHKQPGECLEDYLDNRVFAAAKTATLMADETDMAGFDTFHARYRQALEVEAAAIKAF